MRRPLPPRTALAGFGAVLAAAVAPAQPVSVGPPRAAAGEEPSSRVDADGLAWQDDELALRIAAARALCAAGAYEAALATLPGPGTADGLAAREHARVAAALARRDELLRGALRDGARLAPLVGGERIGGDVVAVDAMGFVLRDRGDERRLPLTALDAPNLANELRKHGLVGRDAPLHAWLEWLGGQPPARAMRALPPADEATRQLREDLDGDFDARAAAPAAALALLQQLEPASAPARARAQLETLRTAVLEHRDQPPFARRAGALRHAAAALAERAFSLGDPRCLGLAGHARPAGEGRIAVEYRGDRPELGRDFAFDAELAAQMTKSLGRLATAGHALERTGEGCYSLRGSGVFLWPLPLRGAQQIRMRLSMTAAGYYQFLLCLDRAAGHIEVAPTGLTRIVDRPTQLRDLLGTPSRLFRGRVHELLVEHDGERHVVVSVDGVQVAALERVGGRVRGEIGLFVHASDPLHLHRVAIEGEVDPSAAPRLRARWVERVLEELWPR